MTEAEWKDEIRRRDEIISSYKYLEGILIEYENSYLSKLGLRISKWLKGGPTP